MDNIIIADASGHGKVIIVDIVEKEGKFKLIKLVDTYKEKNYYGYPIIGTEHELPSVLRRILSMAE